jgi:hypothetical protein
MRMRYGYKASAGCPDRRGASELLQPNLKKRITKPFGGGASPYRSTPQTPSTGAAASLQES